MRRLLAFAIIALATTCRSLPFPDPELHGEYGKALKKWTRQVALYSGLETRAFVRMVYLSPDFVDSQAKEISRMRAEMPDKAAETAAKLHQEYRQPSFFAVVYTPDKTANDWNEPSSVWRLALNLGLGEYSPDRVTRFDPPFNAELRALYPYLDEYSVGYLIKFTDPVASIQANTPDAQRFTPTEAQLIVASALGKMLFRWRLDGGAEEQPTAESGPEQKPVTTPKP